MKITVLVDNSDGIRAQGEWGLSLYIEYGDKTVLLDTGLSGLFARNAAAMGIDLAQVDAIVLSHAHDDHAGGLARFLELNDQAKLYVANECYENCYDRPGIFYKYAGIPKGTLDKYSGRLVRAKGRMQISEGIWLIPHTTAGLEKTGATEKMYLRQGFMKYVPDDFRHEQSLVFEMGSGLVVFNSCSHAGADVIIKEAEESFPGREVLAMIGGFHLFNKSDEYVRAFAGRVQSTGVKDIYTGHCTGQRAERILKERLGDSVHSLHTGLKITL